jgi:hypothetical protein
MDAVVHCTADLHVTESVGERVPDSGTIELVHGVSNVDDGSKGTSKERGDACSNSIRNHGFTNRVRITGFLGTDQTPIERGRESVRSASH